MFDRGGSPPHIVELFRRPALRLCGGNGKIRRRFRHPRVPGNKLHVPSAFERAIPERVVNEKLFQRCEQQRAESTTIWVSALKETALQQHKKKALSQILGVWNGTAAPADESENGAPINAAKVGQGAARLILVRAGFCAGKNHAPARSREPIQTLLAYGSGLRVHERS